MRINMASAPPHRPSAALRQLAWLTWAETLNGLALFSHYRPAPSCVQNKTWNKNERKQNHILSPCINKSLATPWLLLSLLSPLLLYRTSLAPNKLKELQKASWPIVWAKSCKLPPPSASLWLHFVFVIKLHLQHSQSRSQSCSHAPQE